jgi:dTDP-4-dehydrorhamnose reductase
MIDSYVIFGANGQLGSALCALLGERAIPVTTKDADFSNPTTVEAFLKSLPSQPRAVINAAAYTLVDKAEEEEEKALTINAKTPGVIARWCAEKKIPFVHYSTDYVFPGTGTAPWKEDDATAPLNAYGRGKLAGEYEVAQAGGNYLIFRTSWVYDGARKNFLTTMLRLGAERASLSVVDDQRGAPTYAPDLAEATLEALNNAMKSDPFPSGVYHLCGNGETSWYGFADTIFAKARAGGMPLALTTLTPIPSSSYPTPAKRPLNSRMDCSRAEGVLGVRLPGWEESLEVCFVDRAEALKRSA